MHPNEITKRDVSNSGVDFAQNIKHIAIKDKGELHFSHLFGGDFLFLLYLILPSSKNGKTTSAHSVIDSSVIGSKT